MRSLLFRLLRNSTVLRALGRDRFLPQATRERLLLCLWVNNRKTSSRRVSPHHRGSHRLGAWSFAIILKR